jgi:hypothetical protein
MWQRPKSGGGPSSCCGPLLLSDGCLLGENVNVNANVSANVNVNVDVRWAGLGWDASDGELFEKLLPSDFDPQIVYEEHSLVASNGCSVDF